MSEETKEAVDSLHEGSYKAFKEKIEEVLKEKALERINARKIEIGQSMFAEQEDDDDDEDDEDNNKKKKSDDDEDDDEVSEISKATAYSHWDKRTDQRSGPKKKSGETHQKNLSRSAKRWSSGGADEDN